MRAESLSVVLNPFENNAGDRFRQKSERIERIDSTDDNAVTEALKLLEGRHSYIPAEQYPILTHSQIEYAMMKIASMPVQNKQRAFEEARFVSKLIRANYRKHDSPSEFPHLRFDLLDYVHEGFWDLQGRTEKPISITVCGCMEYISHCSRYCEFTLYGDSQVTGFDSHHCTYNVFGDVTCINALIGCKHCTIVTDNEDLYLTKSDGRGTGNITILVDAKGKELKRRSVDRCMEL